MIQENIRMKRIGWLWVLATLLFFQASDVTLRLASVDTHFVVGTMLQALPLMIVSIIVLGRKIMTERFTIAPQFWGLAILYGLLQFFLGNAMFYLAVQLGGLTIATPSVQSQAIWAVLLGALFLKEKISRMMLIGASFFIIGILGLSWFKSMGVQLAEGWLWAFVFGLLGGLAWTSASVVQRLQLQKGVPLYFILAVGSLTGVILFNILTFSYYGAGVWHNVDLVGSLQVLAAGCFNGLAIWSFSQAIKVIEISKVIPVISLNIVFNTLNGGLLFGEYISLGTVLSMLILFLGVVLVQEPPFVRRGFIVSKREFPS